MTTNPLIRNTATITQPTSIEPTRTQPVPAVPSAAKAVGVAVALTAVTLLVAGAPRSMAMQWNLFGEHGPELLGGIVRLLVGLGGLLYLRRRGWLGLAGIGGGWKPSGLSSSWLLGVTAALPCFGLFFTEWPLATIGSWAIYIVGTVVFETVIFRGVIFTLLARSFSLRSRGLRDAAVVSAVLFGLGHIHPVGIAMAAAVGLAFTRLQLDTRSIYPAMVLHFVFDNVSQLPLDVDGNTIDSVGALGSLLAGFTLIVAAGLAVIALNARRDQTLDAAMGVDKSKASAEN